MSSTYSRESADSRSRSSGAGCAPSRFVSAIPSVAPCSESIGPECPATTTCEQLMLFDWPPMESGEISSAAGSPAKTSVPQESGSASTAREAAYGASSPELLATFDRATCSWRTSQLCLGGEFQECSETWPRSGMTRNGIAFQLAPLVRLTDAIESGFLPTPAAILYGSSNNGCPGDGRLEYATKGKPGLEMMARRNLWPTPVTGESLTGHGRRGGSWGNGRQSGLSLDAMAKSGMWPTPRVESNRASRRALTMRQWSAPALEQAVELRAGILPREYASIEELPPVALRMWPTPTEGDAKSSGSRNTPQSRAHPGISLTDAVRQDGGTGRLATAVARETWPTPDAHCWKGGERDHQLGGSLNPTWVEWLMGFPAEWTALNASEMPSSRKSSK